MCGEKRLCKGEKWKRRGRRDEKDEEEKGIEIGGVERRREFRERVGSGQRSYGRKGQPLILRSESITMDCFWHPQDSGGCQVGGGHLEGKK